MPAVSLTLFTSLRRLFLSASSWNSASCWDSHCYNLQHAGKIIMLNHFFGPLITNLQIKTNLALMWCFALILCDIYWVFYSCCLPGWSRHQLSQLTGKEMELLHFFKVCDSLGFRWSWSEASMVSSGPDCSDPWRPKGSGSFALLFTPDQFLKAWQKWSCPRAIPTITSNFKITGLLSRPRGHLLPSIFPWESLLLLQVFNHLH